uniref:C2H2-type domain-containing protein n=1 Tax=Myripristis murdjan TaxID=586833 RepID=A0A667ZQC0_9TELE
MVLCLFVADESQTIPSSFGNCILSSLSLPQLEKVVIDADQIQLQPPSEVDMERHMKSHSEDRPYKCAFCEKKFKHPYVLKRHQKEICKSKYLKKPVLVGNITEAQGTDSQGTDSQLSLEGLTDGKLCPICSRILPCTADITKHLRSHTEDRPFICVTCEKGFKYKDTLKKHQIIHGHEGIREEESKSVAQILAEAEQQNCSGTITKKENNPDTPAATSGESPPPPLEQPSKKVLKVCTVCARAFDSVKTLNKHMQCHTDDRPYHCIHCKRRFKHMHGDHQQEPPLKIPVWCSNCGKHFEYPSDLKEHQENVLHMGTHSEEKPWACTQCDMAYRTKLQLTNHVEQIHIGVRYPCNSCGKQFMKEVSLRRHELIHTGERPHQCTECGKTFLTANELRLHNRYHTGERPYKCESHMRIHTGEKPFKCDICDKAFRLSYHMKKHRRTHSGKSKSHMCEECGLAFTHKKSLCAHYTLSHNVKIEPSFTQEVRIEFQ